jgi:hypothetical protein
LRDVTLITPVLFGGLGNHLVADVQRYRDGPQARLPSLKLLKAA